jgi:hypothetical protein
MDDTMQVQPSRKRRHLRVWALIGAAGLITGAAYSSGFATTTSVAPLDGADDVATPAFGQQGAALDSLYSGTVSAQGTVTITTFDGVYGVIPNTKLFEVDLTGNDPYGKAYTGTFFADVYITNWAALGYQSATPEWSQLNFKFLQSAATFDCSTTAYATAPAAFQQLSVDRVDAHVTFGGLAAGNKYCIGLKAETALTQSGHPNTGGVVDGTFITRPDTTVIPAVAPQFMAVMNRSA